MGFARQRWDGKAFAYTAAYDAAITAYLRGQGRAAGDQLMLDLYSLIHLRYGENPHQQATLYGFAPDAGPLGGELIHGKPLSYNNLLDLDVAIRAVAAFDRPAVCIVKHLSPCGLAVRESLSPAFEAALASDPVSAFGGVIAANQPLDPATAQKLGDLFVECLAAPGFESEALTVLVKRQNIRLLKIPNFDLEPGFELRSINHGVLYQTIDTGDPEDAEWQVVTERQPTHAELLDLQFAWKVCQHVRSNAIVCAQKEATVGIGGGQPNRVDSVRLATQRAGERARGAVLASDAFFPFPDAIEEAAKAGITAIVSPGGSVRDQEVIAAANLAGIALVFTGVRHFRH